MFIDFIVISEVVNRAIKIEYDKYIQKNNFSKNKLSYKKYRDSKEGQNTINDVYQIIKNKMLHYQINNNYFFLKKNLKHLLM